MIFKTCRQILESTLLAESRLFLQEITGYPNLEWQSFFKFDHYILACQKYNYLHLNGYLLPNHKS
jgi:hypothetical protein